MASHYHYLLSKSPSPKMTKENSKETTIRSPPIRTQPEKSKINFIRNERKRIEVKCSTKTTAAKHQNMFDNVLRLNGYPEGTIDQTMHSQNLSTRDLSTQNGRT